MRVAAAFAFERLSADARFAGYSGVARVILAGAWADGAPLRPGSVPGDAEALVVAELHVRRGDGVRGALERARAETIELGTLRGAVRFASCRHAHDYLGAELAERGIRSVEELGRPEAVGLAIWLCSLPADVPDEQAIVAESLALVAPLAADVVHEPAGSVLAGCFNCGNPVGADDPTIGVYYLVAGRGGNEGRYEWRTASPAIEHGEYESAATIAKRQGEPRQSEFLSQALAGAHLLCVPCAVRARAKLIGWPIVGDDAADELEEER